MVGANPWNGWSRTPKIDRRRPWWIEKEIQGQYPRPICKKHSGNSLQKIEINGGRMCLPTDRLLQLPDAGQQQCPCNTCDRMIASKIGLISHVRAHMKKWNSGSIIVWSNLNKHQMVYFSSHPRFRILNRHLTCLIFWIKSVQKVA